MFILSNKRYDDRLFGFPATLLIVLLMTMDIAQGAMESELAFYLDMFGEVRPEQDPQVARAHAVFKRVRAVADKSTKRLSKLVIVNSTADPWAIALPSGHIVLSKRAVAICHQQADIILAETRLAFVLGHELTHLAHDDFWHQEIYGFLAKNPATEAIAGFIKTHNGLKVREMAADDKGFIYAAMAGYPVARLINKNNKGGNFFHYWMEQTNTRLQSSHPDATSRAAVLQERLRVVEKKLGFFSFGVRLSHFDYCDDAVYFLREFQQVFPSREVLNNMGFCYLQMARQEMAPHHAYLYWMPLLLDGKTRARTLNQRGPTSLKSLQQAAVGKAREYLNDAISYLQRAAQADPNYLAARVNLAVANLYLGKPHQARAVLDEASKLAPDDLTLQTLEALVLYEQGGSGIDLWSQAVAKLEILLDKGTSNPLFLFNLARLYQLRPRPAQAQIYWDRLAKIRDRLPAPIRTIVCKNANLTSPCATPAAKTRGQLRWAWPLPATGFTRLGAEQKAKFMPDWKATAFDWVLETLHGHIYQNPDGSAEVLELDNFLHLQVLREKHVEHVNQLTNYCAQALRKRVLAQGVVWSCDNWAALAHDDRVLEAWWIAK